MRQRLFDLWMVLLTQKGPLRPSVLCSFYSTLGTGGRRFSRSKAGRFARLDFADLASTPLQSSGLPTPRPLWLRLRRVVSLPQPASFTNPRKRRLQPLPA
jgi:hypothetical protein